MRLINFFKDNKMSILSMLLVTLAVALGADGAFAMSDVTIATNGATEAGVDTAGENTQLNGTAATATHATETGFEEDEYEKQIAKFRPFRFPLEHDIVMEATQVHVKTYHPKHFRSGSATLETSLKEQVTASGTGLNDQDVTLNTTNCNNLKILPEFSCVYAKGVKGYADDGITEDGDLAMFVTKNDGTSATLRVLNPKNGTATVLKNATELIVGSTAGSESQMIVEPDNYQPVPYEVYLQKSISNIVFTDEWLEQAKKVPFILTDIKNNALYNFKRKNARTHWLGRKKLIKITVDKTVGDEYIYFSEGILRQINKYYSYNNDKLTVPDLTGIAKMQFAKNSANDVAKVYCGKNAIERLLNIDLTIHKEIKFESVNVAGMTIRAWKNNFGQMDFVHDPTLDDIGYEDFMVVVDIKNACHYVKRKEKTDVQDMKKGAGNIREMKREIYSCIDAIALKGYNAILVGPADRMSKASRISTISLNAKTESKLPTEKLTDGMVVYLTAADGGFSEGTLVQYDLATEKWHEYVGEIAA